MERFERQRLVAMWCAEAFGGDQAASVKQRGIRLLEEAVEAYQACGCEEEMAHKLVGYIFQRDRGRLPQELGGLGVTILALAEAAGLDADEEEHREVKRVLSKPREHFRARNQAKNDAGFLANGVDPENGTATANQTQPEAKTE